MRNNKRDSQLNPLDKLRLHIDFAGIVLSLLGGLTMAFYPVGAGPLPALLLPVVFFLSLLIHSVGILYAAPRLVNTVEYLIVIAATAMWWVVWKRGEQATILMPAFIVVVGLYGLTHPRLLYSYLALSMTLFGLLFVYRPELDPTSVLRAWISTGGVVVLVYFLRVYTKLLERSSREHEKLEQTLNAILKAAKIDVFDERVRDGSGAFIHSYHAPEVPFVGAEQRLDQVEPEFREALKTNLERLNVPTEFRFKLSNDDNADYSWYRQQSVYEYVGDEGELHRIGFSQNIDDEIRARAELAQKQKFVEVEIQKFDSVCRQLNLVFWQLNLSTWKLTYNLQFAERWNLAVGGELEFSALKSFMHPAYIGFHENGVNQVVAQKSAYISRYCAPAGEREGRWFELTYSPVFGANAELIAVNVANIEITELIRTEGEMTAKNNELVRQQMREKNLYAVIAHELRTPSAILKMMLEQEEKGLGQIDRRLFATTVDNLLGVVDTLRTVSQPDKIASQTFETVLLSELISSQIAILQTLAKDGGMTLGADYASLKNRPVSLMAGPLKQLLSNLIKNAIIHSGGSQVLLSAESSLTIDEKKCLVIRVDDDGRGIESDQIERLFEAFERGSDVAGGTGLGLYISREIARMMGGDLRYEPSHLGGARFVLEFCLALVPPETVGPDEPVVSDRLMSLSVLLVEDDPAILQMTAAILSEEVARLRIAKNGQQALEVLSKSSPDLVLTDIFMPEMSGIELVKTMRDLGYSQPVVGLTAATLGRETEELLKAGADAVLNKPIDLKSLTQVVSGLDL